MEGKSVRGRKRQNQRGKGGKEKDIEKEGKRKTGR